MIYTLWPQVTSGKVSSRWLILEKWLRCVPLISALLALEFCWPLIGSGPLYKQGSEYVLENCSKNWLRNILLVNNWSPSLQKCAPQLFHSAVDFQLFLIGLPAALLLYKNRRAGIAFCSLIIVSAMIMTGYAAHSKQTLPNFISRDASVE